MLQGTFFAEQVVVGMLAVLAATLPFRELTMEWLTGASLFSSLGAVLVAYAIGATFDRLADSVMEGLEDWRTAAPSASPGGQSRSAAHERRLLVELLHQDGLTRRVEYMRTRIRLTRSVAVFSPVIGLSAALRDTTLSRPVVALLLFCAAGCYAVVVWSVGRSAGTQPSHLATPVWLGWACILGLTAVATAQAQNRPLTGLYAALSFGVTVLAGWSWRRIRLSLLRLLEKQEESASPMVQARR